MNKKLSNHIFVVTGATAGIGFECAKQFYRQGALVVLASRSKNKLESAVSAIENSVTPENKPEWPLVKPETLILDLMDLEQVAKAGAEYKQRFGKVDVLLNNAGVMNLAKKTLSPQNLEAQIATCHFGHFLFTELLLNHMQDGGRVVNVSSCESWICQTGKRAEIDFDDMNFEQRDYNGWTAYGQAKLANYLHAIDLARRPDLKQRKITAVALHPGFVMTDLFSNTWGFGLHYIVGPFMKFWMGSLNTWEGAQTSLHCCLNKDIPSHNGKFFAMKNSSRMVLWKERPELNAGGWPFEHPGRADISDEMVTKFREVGYDVCKKWRQ